MARWQCKVAVLGVWQTLVARWLQCPDLSPDKCPAATFLLLFFFFERDGKQAQQRLFLDTKVEDHNHDNTLVIDRQYLVFTDVEMIYPWWGIMNQQPSFATRAVVEMSPDKSRPKLLLSKIERNNFAKHIRHLLVLLAYPEPFYFFIESLLSTRSTITLGS